MKYDCNRIMDLMDIYNVGRNELLKEVGISNTVLQNLIDGVTTPNVELRKKFRRFFNWREAFPNLPDSLDCCTICELKCKQYYFVSIVSCPKTKKRK